MKKTIIGIVEDEAIIADTLVSTLEKLGYQTSEPCSSYTETLILLESEKPDLFLIDIQLAGKKNGIELASKIRELYNIPFIYLTSNSDEATIEAAKPTYPMAYLLKPFNKEDLYTSIELALYKHSESEKNKATDKTEEDSAFVKEDGKLIKINFENIIYVNSDHVYIQVHTTEKKHMLRMKLEEFQQSLPKNFVQVHRRYVVNIKKVNTIANNYLIADNIEIPVSSGYKENLLNSINRI